MINVYSELFLYRTTLQILTDYHPSPLLPHQIVIIINEFAIFPRHLIFHCVLFFSAAMLESLALLLIAA